MTWIHFVVLVLCCHWHPFNSPSSLSSLTVGAVRLRENSNVLVPNNDVNVKAKIKQALNGDVDVDELKSVGINKIIESVKNPKSEKLIVDQLERGARNGNENQQPVMAASAMNFTTENSTWSYTTPTTVGFNENVTTTPENFTTPEWTMTTQQTNESTTMSFNFTSDVPTTWTTPSDINATTTYNETSTTPTYYESTVSNETTPDSTSTTHTPQTNSILTNECVLSDQSDIKPKWIDTDGKLLEDAIKAEDGSVEILDFSRNFQTQLDYDKFIRTFVQINNLLHVKYLSMAFNGLTELPNRILNLWNTTLSHLSLAGNNFGVTLENSIGFDHFPSLRHLDLRRCRLQNIKKHYFQHLTALTYLDVSNNEIIEIFPDAFPPSLVHLDLSRNIDPSLIQGLTIRDKVFTQNSLLISIDFSHTRIKIEDKSALALRQMPASLRFVSFCYVDLPNFEGNLFLNSKKIEMLDLSGNSRFNFTSEKFEFIQNSLEVLTVRSSNIRELNWLENMSNLRSLNLSDNNINSLAKENFRHMEKLVELNLARNSIGNWYEQLFANNQQLDVLNLRDNKLTRLTNDMREDLSGVKFLALGKNSDFECSCEIEAFLHKLFRDTRAANFTAMQQIDTEFHIVDETEHLSSAQPTRIFLASRSSNPRYDVIQRTLQKYYKMAEASVEALKIREVKSSSGGLVMRKSATANSDNSYDKTLLFDYREDADDYQCINATAKERRPIIELDLCSSERQSERSDENATPKRISTLTIVSVSFTSVIIVSVLSIVVYWKWWYVKYFFVLCKNSAILTFMDDSPESDAIIAKKRTSRASIDAYIYDVFVSYSEQNRNWVLSEFIPNVEKRESINICLHERDFTVGSGILENIISCMDQSRCLLLLISSDFLQSQWCLFEMNLAQHRLLETRREKLILVLLEDIPEKRQPRTLRYLMRTKTYIKWPQNGGKDEKMLFWRRLKKAIISTRWELESYGSAV